MVRITGKHLRQIVDYCTEELPYEACGVLWGEAPGPMESGCEIKVGGWDPVPNTSSAPIVSFRLAPEHWIRHLYSQTPEKSLVGIFHSHPAAPAFPSIHDLDMEWDLPTYWIVSLSVENRPNIRAFRIWSKTNYEEQTIIPIP